MDKQSEWSKDIAGLKIFLKNLNKVIDILYKKAKRAGKEMQSRTKLPVSIPINM